MTVRWDQLGGSRVLFRLEDTFDEADAWRLHDALSRLDQDLRITLDFHKVRDFHDFAVSLLAQDLASSRDTRIAVQGLGQHQRRLLGYFGIKDEAPLGDTWS